MFFHGNHDTLLASIEAIGANFAVYEFIPETKEFSLISCNTKYEEILGKEKSEAIGQSLVRLFPRYIAMPLQQSFLECKLDMIAVESEIFIEYMAEERWWRSIISPIIESKTNITRIIQTCVEITEKKHLEKLLSISKNRFEAVVESAYDGIISIDEKQTIQLMNNSARQIFQIQDNDVIGMPLVNLIPMQYRSKHPKYVNGFKDSMASSRPMQSRAAVRGIRSDGTEFPIEVTISKIKVDQKIEMTAVVRDISDKNKLMEELILASREDPMTKLFNRRYFTNVVSEEITRLKRYNRPFSLIMLDIDYFKMINDTFGHLCGDKVLIDLSDRLRHSFRKADVISRWGGEEFLVMLPETSMDHIMVIAEKVRLAIECQAFEYCEHQIHVTISLGVTTVTNDDSELDHIFSKVDQALYSAKKNGRNCIVQI